MILPGATLGVLGGGQLGRMFVMAARTLGYEVIVLDADADSPAGSLANRHLCAAYDDPHALTELATHCAAITTEFENVPAQSLHWLAQHTRVYPAATAVAVMQDRQREKAFIQNSGLATARCANINHEVDLTAAITRIGTPAVLKTSRYGYDGKGQALIHTPAQAFAAYTAWGAQPCILEERVAIARELSVVVARATQGSTACYPVAENQHRDGILDISIVPARVPEACAARAQEMAMHLATQLQYVGVLAVEFFLLEDDRLLVNELAPRPHNSGHYTLDACVTPQFEQQVRALCDLPLGDTRLLSPVVMLNVLGDLWQEGTPPWARVFAQPGAKLHLYGKRVARRGRKMGHINCLAATPQQALDIAEDLRAQLTKN